MTIKLSICIATYNRARFLREALDSIIYQLTSECEIVISDNASTDETQTVVSEYVGRFPNVRYYRNQSNIGLDRNFDTAVSMADGEYCWLFADDDIFKEGAVAAVLAATRDNYSLVIVNWEQKTLDLSTTLVERRFHDLAQDKVLASSQADELYSYVRSLVFIGCIIIARSVWISRHRSMYYGSFLIHLGVIFQQPLPNGCVMISQPLVSNRDGNARTFWHQVFEILAVRLPAVTQTMAISDSLKAAANRAVPEIANLLFYRGMKIYSLAQYRQFLRTRIHTAQDRLVALFIAILPSPPLNLFLVAYYRWLSNSPFRKARLYWLTHPASART
jgi:glycosyltransferase involved in cell wall biosynthesis